MKKKQKKWGQFEISVAAMFRAAGYEVEENKEDGGFEWDMIVTEPGLAGPVRTAVECKQRTTNAVSNMDILSFVTAFSALRDVKQLAYGIVVTDHAFSRQAHEAAATFPLIRLMTEQVLEDRLIGANLYLEQASRMYRSEGHDRFIDLAAEQYQAREWEKPFPIKSIAAHCVEKFQSEPGHCVFLFGDFGSGKTTLAERIHSHLVAGRRAGESEIFPVMMYLRTIQNFDTNQAFLETQLRLSAATANVGMIERVRAKRPVLFIMDGFDEVATNAIKEERMMLLSRVLQLSAQADHLLITSRPSIFTNLEEINDLVDQLTERDFAPSSIFAKPALVVDRHINTAMSRMLGIMRKPIIGEKYRTFPPGQTSIFYLSPLSKGDVIAYLSPNAETFHQLYGKSVRDIYDILINMYDLKDLLTRPLLLQMFMDLLLSGNVKLDDADLEFGPATLYKNYVNVHLDRDWKVRQHFARDTRLAFARAAAIAMLEAGGSLEATHESIEAVIRSGSKLFAALRKDEILGNLPRAVSDFLVCAFISVTPRGRVEFSHKSFMEYFIADVIMLQIADNMRLSLLDCSLNYEILQFMGAHCLIRRDYKLEMIRHLSGIGRGESKKYQTNLKIALFFAERQSKGERYRDIDFHGIRLGKRDFEKCNFEGIHLSGLKLDQVSMVDCSFTDTSLSGDIVKLQVRGGSGSLKVSGTLQGTEFTDCDHLRLYSDTGGRIIFDGGRIGTGTLTIDASTVTLSGVEIIDGRLRTGRSNRFELLNCKLHRCEIFGDGLPFLNLTGCSIVNALLNGVQCTPSEFRAVKDQLVGSRGVVFIDDREIYVPDFWLSDAERSRTYRGHAFVGDLLVITIKAEDKFRGQEDKVRDLVRRRDLTGLRAWAKAATDALSPPRAAAETVTRSQR